jgi:DNA-binding HxlR family transcriptional regulator
MSDSHLKVTEPLQDVYAGACPARALLDRIADKWTTLIIGILGSVEGPLRFGDLRHKITGISQKMLTQTLRDLERDGLVVRRAYPVIPPRVEYSLTPLGQTLEEPMRALSDWAERHMGAVREAQERFDAERERIAKSA